MKPIYLETSTPKTFIANQLINLPKIKAPIKKNPMYCFRSDPSKLPEIQATTKIARIAVMEYAATFSHNAFFLSSIIISIECNAKYTIEKSKIFSQALGEQGKMFEKTLIHEISDTGKAGQVLVLTQCG